MYVAGERIRDEAIILTKYAVIHILFGMILTHAHIKALWPTIQGSILRNILFPI